MTKTAVSTGWGGHGYEGFRGRNIRLGLRISFFFPSKELVVQSPARLNPQQVFSDESCASDTKSRHQLCPIGLLFIPAPPWKWGVNFQVDSIHPANSAMEYSIVLADWDMDSSRELLMVEEIRSCKRKKIMEDDRKKGQRFMIFK